MNKANVQSLMPFGRLSTSRGSDWDRLDKSASFSQGRVIRDNQRIGVPTRSALTLAAQPLVQVLPSQQRLKDDGPSSVAQLHSYV